MSQFRIPLIERLIQSVTELRNRALTFEQSHKKNLEQVDPSYRDSVRNLLHYLSVRQIDIRQPQKDLTTLGLSSLGGSEAHMLSTLNAVLVALYRLAGREWNPPDNEKPPVNFRTGPILLDDHTQRLMGTPYRKRSVRIMVTMPSEAATNPTLVRDLLEAGMDVMRINCAHDNPDVWLAMISNLRKAEQELGRICNIYADLAGPKVRTGAIQSSGRIVKLNPRRDLRGTVVNPFPVWLTSAADPQPAPEHISVTLPLAPSLFEQINVDDELEIMDSRGSGRKIQVIEQADKAYRAESTRTLFIEEGAKASIYRQDKLITKGTVGELPDVMLPILLTQGDTLIVTKSDEAGQNAIRNEEGEVLEPARIPCTLKGVFNIAQPGERVLFDDGKIVGEIVENTGEEIRVLVTQTGPKGAKLRPEKGINWPDTELDIEALTPKDLQDLEFVVKYVDIIGLSFVRTVKDVASLQEKMHDLRAGHIGVVLKIENRQAFEQLPYLLAEGLKSPPLGIMVARGDLAAEVGFARMAEVQEQILWLCEAGHVPVIWATQVLESLAQKGSPSRAEISDAVMSGRAECVMLNKGPYIVEAVRFLSGILERMQTHQSKRRATLRKLSVSETRSV